MASITSGGTITTESQITAGLITNTSINANAAIGISKLAPTGNTPAWNGNALTGILINTLSAYRSNTLSSAGPTLCDFTTLDINTDGNYLLVLKCINNTAIDSIISLYYENDLTATDYYSQNMRASGASVTAGLNNTAQIAYMYASKESNIYVYISLVNGYIKAIANQADNQGASINLLQIAQTKTASVANITRLTIIAGQNLAIGSSARLFRYG